MPTPPIATATHVHTTLSGLASRLTTYLPTCLANIETEVGGSLSLPDPLDYFVSDEIDDSLSLPVVALSVEGNTDERNWLSPQRDVVIPLLAALVHATGDDDPELTAKQSWLFVRALSEALDYCACDAATGVWHIAIRNTSVEPLGDKGWRMAVVRADLYTRTSRSK